MKIPEAELVVETNDGTSTQDNESETFSNKGE